MTNPLGPDEDPPLVCADRIGRLRWPAGTTEDARVILTRPPGDNPDGKPAELFVWTGGRPPVLRFRDRWIPAESDIAPDGHGTWWVATDAGRFKVQPGGGCASCGTALSAQPWHPWHVVSMPPDLGRNSP